MDQFNEPNEPNELEQAILAVRAGALSQQEFVAKLVGSRIAVPSRTEVLGELGAVRPILLDKGNETFVAAYTEVVYADAFRNLASYCLQINALAWLRAMPRDVGLVLNPGMDATIQFSAPGVQQIVRNFSPEPIN
ncbi:SseB family protein [Terriglobus sp.]|uniref:SseB family protein n=1 Tax=Terriglobus sp. TaxID=1889013 RepID=UPI003B00CD84